MHPSPKHRRLASSARAESGKWDTSPGSPGLGLGLAGKFELSRMTACAKHGKLLCPLKERNEKGQRWIFAEQEKWSRGCLERKDVTFAITLLSCDDPAVLFCLEEIHFLSQI